MTTGSIELIHYQRVGMIQPCSGGRDVFVDIGAVERAGLNDLDKRQELLRSRGARQE